MSARLILAALAAAAMASVGTAEPKTYHQTQTPRVLSDWHTSRDGKVSLCLAVDKTTFKSKEPISVRCALRNNTDKPITILRPFGDIYYAQSSGLIILGPEGEVRYHGAVKDYMLGMADFVELGPKTIIDETLELARDKFPAVGKAGLYSINYLFTSGGYPRQSPPENFWKGEIKSGMVTILVQ